MTISQQLAFTALQIIAGGGEADVRVPAVQIVTAEDFTQLVQFFLRATLGGGTLEVEDITDQQPELPLA